MILDNQLVLSAEQDIVAISGGGNTASTNTIVVGKADLGYKGMFISVIAREEIKTAGTNGTLTIEIQASDDSTFSSSTTLVTKVVTLGATATPKDTILFQDILRDVKGLKYVRVKYTGTTYVKASAQSTIKVDAFLSFDYPTK